ncbi:MAG: diguanylate cyclase [Proteobacteria bacterium]|nr:diguanylate cyclase [Pseudomonadota bacterium]
MGEPAVKIVAPLDAWLEEFRSTLEIFLDAYCVVDIAGKVVDFNLAFTELVGESHRKILKIGNFSDLVRLTSDVNPCIDVMLTEKALRLDEVMGSSKAYPELKLIIGAVPVFSKSREVVGALITLRNVTAEAVLLSKYDEKKKDSVTDGLTSLYNKVYMEETVTKSIKNSLRDLRPVTLVMCDIDHFKKVNDTHGHQAGDYVLKIVAATLKNMMRETDCAGRFGGEEFVVLLNNCNEQGAEVFAERFRKGIETTLFIFEGKRIPVTLSQGTATLNRAWEDGLNPEAIMTELFQQADTALYQAKHAGRNRVIQFKKS